MICLKLPILIVERLAFHQNGVEFHQQFNGAIRTSLTVPYDHVQHRATSPKICFTHTYTHKHIHHVKATHRARLPLLKSESLDLNWSQSSHFVTFWANHQIKKILLQKLFCLVCFLRFHIKSESEVFIWSKSS